MRSRPLSAMASRLIPAILLAGSVAVPWSVTPPLAQPRAGRTRPAAIVGRGPDAPGAARRASCAIWSSATAIDRAALGRRYPVDQSPERIARLKRFYGDWQARVAHDRLRRLGVEGRIDHRAAPQLAYELRLLGREEQVAVRHRPAAAVRRHILALNDARVRMDTLDAEKAAATLDTLAAQIDATRRRVEAAAAPPAGAGRVPVARNGASGATAPPRRTAAGTAAAATRAPIKATKLCRSARRRTRRA